MKNEDLIEEKFKKFAKGKLELDISGEIFEIDLTVEERLPILHYLVASARAGSEGKPVSSEIISNVKNNLVAAFSRSYPDVKKDVVYKFVDSVFELIVTEIAMKSGWITKEAIEKQIKKLGGQKK